ncbi:MAG: response regulator transcription factor, partial [Duodenibacillus sp.]|nr:response regulator transcription factor [Duodenibacillus sp.]
MTDIPPVIRIVDDDAAIRASLAFMLECEGYAVRAFSSGEAFLTGDTPSTPGCIILDIRMPGLSGLEVQQRLAERRCKAPVLFLTGHGDMEMAVQAMKDGAVDFIAKPIDAAKFLAAVTRALRIDRERRGLAPTQEDARAAYGALTDREKETLALLAQGLLNREVAKALGISERTVEGHRRNGFHKLKVKTAAELAA